MSEARVNEIEQGKAEMDGFTEAESQMMDRLYRDAGLRAKVLTEMSRRTDTAQNRLMLLLAEAYIDGYRDGRAVSTAR
jgi:hypothetical protein